MRKRPSAATVLAATALFFSLSGPAMAALIISQNNQVAAHVIAGSEGPAADHKNIVPKSIGTFDLYDGIVTARKLDLPRIDFSGLNTDPSSRQHHVVLALDRMTIGVSCTNPTHLYVYASSRAANATMRGFVVKGEANASPKTTRINDLLLSRTPTQAAAMLPSGGPVLEAVFTYRDARRVMAVTLDGFVTSQRCRLTGTVAPAPN